MSVKAVRPGRAPAWALNPDWPYKSWAYAMFYVLFPTEVEAAPFLDGLEGLRADRFARKRSYTGTLSGRDVTALLCGIGQANAAQAATAVLEAGDSGLVILGGCAGAYPGSGLSVGSVALATEEVYAGLGMDSPDGFITLEEAGLPLFEHFGSSYYDVIPIPAARGLDAKGLSTGDADAVFGRFLTVTTVTGTTETADMLYRMYGALCENMEGAAAAQTAMIYDAPFVEVRGVSNMVEDREREGWDIPLASVNCADVIGTIIRGWKK